MTPGKAIIWKKKQIFLNEIYNQGTSWNDLVSINHIINAHDF